MVNNVFIEGNLVRDVEVRVINDNLQVAEFTLGVTDKVGPNKPKTTSFVDCVAWNKTAEILGSTFVKGDRVAVAGKLKQESFEPKGGGNKVSKTKVVVDQILSLPARAPKTTAAKPQTQNQDEVSFSFQP